MNRRAFTLIELLTVVLVFGALAALLLIASRGTRRTAQLNESLDNLKTIGSSMGTYQLDAQDLFPMYSWHGGVTPPANDVPTDLAEQALQGSDISAAAAQAVWMMRRWSNQPDLAREHTLFPHHLYWWLPLAEYADWSFSNSPVVSPADANILRWIRNPEAFVQGQIQPAPAQPTYRWLYTSSYAPTIALFSADRGDAPNYTSISFSVGSYDSFAFTNTRRSTGILGRRSANEVAFPSQKITITDRAQRHFGTDRFVLHTDARAVALAADGAAAIRSTNRYNPGFQPVIPGRTFPEFVYYRPSSWEPPFRTSFGEQLQTRIFTTRGGLQGRDFGGREIDTSSWR